MAVSVVADPVNQGSAPSSPQAPAPSTILTRLRLNTRGEHEAVERVLDLMSPALTKGAYRHKLVQFYGFYSPLEAALQVRCALPEDFLAPGISQLAKLLPRLNKTALLRQDLQCLGVLTDALPLCRRLPAIHTEAEVLGCMYVMEGATLGGRMITQHVLETFGITPTTGCSFFDGYAGDTGRMWQAMRHVLVSCSSDTRTEDAIVANAIATFARLRAWCDPADACAHNETLIYTEANQRA